MSFLELAYPSRRTWNHFCRHGSHSYCGGKAQIRKDGIAKIVPCECPCHKEASA